MAPRTPPPPRAQVLTAGAQQIRKMKGALVGLRREKWQDDAWDIYDLVGEIKQGANFMGNVCSGVRLYVGVYPEDDEQTPPPADENTVGAAEAREILDRMRRGSAHGGLAGMIHEMVVNLKIAGEFIIIAEQEVPPNPSGETLAERMGRPERWNVYSVSEVSEQSRELQVKEAPGDKPRTLRLPGDDEEFTDNADFVFSLRVWQRHPRWGMLADCALRALLSDAEELLILSRAVRGSARSRLATAGILEVPSEYSFESADPDADGDEVEDPEADPFMARLAAATLDAIEDESSPDGQVPIVVRAPASVMRESGIKHTLWTKPVDEKVANERRFVLERMGDSMDLPWEQVTGMGDANHWSAWAIDTASWGRYGEPTMRLICEALTEGILWPYLDAAGVDAAAARRLVWWFDPADAIVDPDESKTADELFDRGGISWEAYRQRKGATEDEAPTPEELALRSQLGLLKGSGMGGGMPTGGQTTDGDGEQTQPQATTASAAFDPSLLARVAAATAPLSLGRKLARIDQRLRAQLAEIAEAAVLRSLERAGARVRSRANGNQQLRAAIDSVPAWLVPSHCGPALMAAVGLTAEEAVAGDTDQLRQRLDTKIRQAQASARRALKQRFRMSDAELDQLEARQADERRDAVAWFMSALGSLVLDRLFDPTPGAPDLGEADVSTSVPADLIRELMTRAGGGATPDGVPDGGVATGLDVLQIWRDNGLKVTGWEWVYGDPPRPFPGHEQLAGVQVPTLRDERLAVLADDAWLGVEFYRPGDHVGCQCSLIPISDDDAETEAFDDDADADATMEAL